MSDYAIKAENLGKKYTIGHYFEKEKYISLRDVIARKARLLQSRVLDLVRGDPIVLGESLEEFWALSDLNFEIEHGDIVGVIGRNGAGKSTLLKILSRITEPSTGTVEINGRVASLLEVGTGFHPELTGRENIYLNGSILGMSRVEIKKKFSSIVDFAGVEKFIDTPVKRYSSGMYVRLAFAVASHLEPEILIIDEVLAVGDYDFQKKCLSKIDDISKSGRTVLFVSHNLPMISSLCKSCIHLDSGKIVQCGSTDEVIIKYQGARYAPKQACDDIKFNGCKNIFMADAWVCDKEGILKQNFSLFEPITLNIRFNIKKRVDVPVMPLLHLFDSSGNYVFLSMPYDWDMSAGFNSGAYMVSCEIPGYFLNSGYYSVTVQANSVDKGHSLEFFEEHVVSFTITDNIIDNPYRRLAKYSYEIPGVVRPLLKWQLRSTETSG